MGIPLSACTLSDGHQSSETEPDAKGFWEKLEQFFLPDTDRHEYAEGLRRGGYLVTVSGLTVEQQLAAADILDHDGTVDIGERSTAWRSEGWSPTPTGLVSDTSQFANSAFDQTHGRLANSDGDDASRSGRTLQGIADERHIEVPVVVEAFRIARRADDGRKRVRIYTVEESDVQPPSHPAPGSTTLF
jgi:hypothetical protein